MELLLWNWPSFYTICLLFLLQLCNASPIFTENTLTDQPTNLLTGLVSISLTICGLILLVGCLCCRRGNRFKEFRNSPVVAASVTSSSSQLDHGHVNPIANNGEFTIFTPLSSLHPHFNNNVFLASDDEIKHTQICKNYDGDSLLRSSSWFRGSDKDFPRVKLKYIRELGKGWFGKVVEGAAQDINNDKAFAWTPVVVRILDASASQKDKLQFLQEASIYRSGVGTHENILKLIGRCLDAVPFLLLQEYCPKGDLKAYLRCQKSNKSMDNFLSTEYPLLWCYQLSSALKFLHDNNILHPDLACRNCHLTEQLNLKLGDYGLGVFNYPNDYYQGSALLPVRWCAPESLQYTPTTIQPKMLSLESNVWSLGVTMWEIYECGKQPYASLSDDEVISQVLGPVGVRLGRPSCAVLYTEYIYRLMQLCWTNAESRPNLTQINLMLADLLQVSRQTDLSPNKSLSADNFDERWESLKPNSIVKTDHVSDTVSIEIHFPEDNHNNNNNKSLSASLNNLHGSLEDLLLSEGKQHDDDLGTFCINDESLTANRIDNNTLTSVELFQKTATSSGSDTEDENWRNKVERGAYTEKVRLKSKSVTDLMILTHVDYSESESETPSTSLDYQKVQNNNHSRNVRLTTLSSTFGSEGNLLSVHDEFQEELKKLQEDRKDGSLLFVPDNNLSCDNFHNNVSSSSATKTCLIQDFNTDIQPIVFNVFNVTIDKYNSVNVNDKFSEIISYGTNLESDEAAVDGVGVTATNGIIKTPAEGKTSLQSRIDDDVRLVSDPYHVENEHTSKEKLSLIDLKLVDTIDMESDKIDEDIEGITSKKVVEQLQPLENIVPDTETSENVGNMMKSCNCRDIEEHSVENTKTLVKDHYPVTAESLPSAVDETCNLNFAYNPENVEENTIEKPDSSNKQSKPEENFVATCSDELQEVPSVDAGESRNSDTDTHLRTCYNGKSDSSRKLEKNLREPSDGLEEIGRGQCRRAEKPLNSLENLDAGEPRHLLENSDNDVLLLGTSYTKKFESSNETNENNANVDGLQALNAGNPPEAPHSMGKSNDSISLDEDRTETAEEVKNFEKIERVYSACTKNMLAHPLVAIDEVESLTKDSYGDEGSKKPTALPYDDGSTDYPPVVDELRASDNFNTNETIVEATNKYVGVKQMKHMQAHSRNEPNKTSSSITDKEPIKCNSLQSQPLEESDNFNSDENVTEATNKCVGVKQTNQMQPQSRNERITSFVMTDKHPIECCDSANCDKNDNDWEIEGKCVNFDLSCNQDETMPNSLTHSSSTVFSSTPFKKKDLALSFEDGFSSLNLYPEVNNSIEVCSRLDQLDYSLETWDNFLGSTLDHQNGVNENLFDSFSSMEPKSLLFIDNEEISTTNKCNDDCRHVKMLTENVETSLREQTDGIVAADGTFSIDNNPISASADDDVVDEVNSTYVKDSPLVVPSNSMPTDLNGASWESGDGGWFLHPQANNDELSGEMQFQSPHTTSYVGFGIDDEVMSAIRNELLTKLPHAQGTATKKITDNNDEEWDTCQRNEVFLKYNVYNTPLSPIPEEESYIEDQHLIGIESLNKEDQDDDSDWSDRCETDTTLTQDTESHSALTLDSQFYNRPHHRHTPSQDSCCSNDTLFNLEELNYTTTELNKDRDWKNDHDPEQRTTTSEKKIEIDNFLLQERIYASCAGLAADEKCNLDLNVNPSNVMHVVPLPSPEDNPWKQMPASLLTFDKVTTLSTLFTSERDQTDKSSTENSTSVEEPVKSGNVQNSTSDTVAIAETLLGENDEESKQGLFHRAEGSSPLEEELLEEPSQEIKNPLAEQSTYEVCELEEERHLQESLECEVEEPHYKNCVIHALGKECIDLEESKQISFNNSAEGSSSLEEEILEEPSQIESKTSLVIEDLDVEESTHEICELETTERFNKSLQDEVEEPHYKDCASHTLEEESMDRNLEESKQVSFSSAEGSSALEDKFLEEPSQKSKKSLDEEESSHDIRELDEKKILQEFVENEVEEPHYKNCSFENVCDPSELLNKGNYYEEIDETDPYSEYVNVVNTENTKNNLEYEQHSDRDRDCYIFDGNNEDDVNSDNEDNNIFGVLTDIRFSGPTDSQLMSTSFSENNGDEQEWDSGSDSRSSSSGEFIWKEGEHEESLKALRAAPHDLIENRKPMEDIVEDTFEESDISSSLSDDDDDEEEETPEFVPSAWDKFAIPGKSVLRSPEKTFNKTEEKKPKGVWFKKQKYHCIYEYPKEPESPVLLQSQDLWKPQTDTKSFTDWEFDDEKSYSPSSLIDGETFNNYNNQIMNRTLNNQNHHQLATNISDVMSSNNINDINSASSSSSQEEFFISSSSQPFLHSHYNNSLSSQFFPGSSNATPDSGVEDGVAMLPPTTTATSSIDKYSSKFMPHSEPPPAPLSLKKLATEAVNKRRHWKREDDSLLGGLRHTRNKLKLDLSPTTLENRFLIEAAAAAAAAAQEPPVNMLLRDKPTFTTFGKSRFLVQQVDTPTDATTRKNVSFEALPYKPLTCVDSSIMVDDDGNDNSMMKIEMVKGEASLLDSGDEDSGIESSTLERKSVKNNITSFSSSSS